MASPRDIMGIEPQPSAKDRTEAAPHTDTYEATQKTSAPAAEALDHHEASFPATSPPVSLDEALAALALDPPGTANMFRALASIFQASQMHDIGIDLGPLTDGSDLWACLRRGDELEMQGVRDTASLTAVREVLERMLMPTSRLLLPALRIMADASRDASWRLPLGESDILEFALRIVASDQLSSELQIQALRLVGNACADTNENRDRVVSNSYMSTLVNRTEAPRLANVAVPVLYNVCCDYDPAQLAAVRHGLFPAMIRTIDSGVLQGTPSLGYLCRLLDLGLEHLDPSQSPENAVELLIRCATEPGLEIEDCVSLVDAAIAHLQVESFQQHMVSQELFGVPLRYLIRSYFPRATLTGTRLPPTSTASSPISRDSDEEAELTRIRKSLIQALSDVSALPAFADRHASLSTPLVDSLSSWITAALPQIQLCSCIVLGNLARNDATCIAMVSRLNIHKDLISVIRTNLDSALLHAALGFLRNLALPVSNKDILGENGLIEALTRFWTSDFMPMVSLAAATVARQLVVGNMANVERLLAPLSSDTESPAHTRSYTSLFLALFERTDESAVKLEIARTMAGVLRTIHSAGTQGTLSKDEALNRLYSNNRAIGATLGAMVTQSRYPVVRSEGWFAMALMARHPEGAVIICEVVTEVSVFTALEEAVAGRPADADASSPLPVASESNTPASPNPPVVSSEMRNRDRDNAMILVNELLQHRVGLQFSDLHLPLERLLQHSA